MKKRLLALYVFSISAFFLCAQSQADLLGLYAYPNLNTSAHKITRTTDGGSLVLGTLFCYSLNGSPIHGCPRGIWILRLNAEGDTIWTKHHDFISSIKLLNIYENDDHSFTIIGGIDGNYQCSFSSISFGLFDKVIAFKISGIDGSLININDYPIHCEFISFDAIQVASGGFWVMGYQDISAGYYSGIVNYPQLLHISADDLSITQSSLPFFMYNGKILEYDSSKLFIISLIKSNKITFSRLDSSGKIEYSHTVPGDYPGYSVNSITKLNNGDIGVMIYRNATHNQYFLRFSNTGQLLQKIHFPYRVTSFAEINDKLYWAFTSATSGEKHTSIIPAGADGRVYNSTTFNWGHTVEIPVQLFHEPGGQIGIMASFDYYNLNESIGPGKIALATFHADSLNLLYSANASAQMPTSSGGHDGVIQVDIAETGTCSSLYNIQVTPYLSTNNNSMPPPLPVPLISGVAAGPISFSGASEGIYKLSITTTGACVNNNIPLEILVTVPPGNHLEPPPAVFIINNIGQVVADTDENTDRSNIINVADLQSPETPCLLADSFYVYAKDQYGDYIDDLSNFQVQFFPNNPQANATLMPLGGGLFMAKVNWPSGECQLSISTQSPQSGAKAAIFMEKNYSSLPPIEIYTDLPDTIVIPACTTYVSMNVKVYIKYPCRGLDPWLMQYSWRYNTPINAIHGNNDYALINITVNSPGVNTLEVAYNSEDGQRGWLSTKTFVIKSTEDIPHSLQSDTDTIKIPACSVPVNGAFGFTLCDHCENLDISAIQFDGGSSGLPNLNGSGFSSVGYVSSLCGHFEVSGPVIPGNHIITISYHGSTWSVPFTILEEAPKLRVQQYGSRPTLDEHGITFRIPACDTCAVFSQYYEIEDGCEAIVPGHLFVKIGSQVYSMTNVNGSNSTYELTLPVCSANDGQIFEIFYEALNGDTHSFSVPMEVFGGFGDQAPPLIFAPDGPVRLTLNDCNHHTANYWLETNSLEFCQNNHNFTINSEITPGYLFLPVDENISLVQARKEGLFSVSLSADDLAGNATADTLYFESEAFSAGNPPVCNDTIDLLTGPQGWADVTLTLATVNAPACSSAGNYLIKVLDNNPSNGSVADECGEFTYEVYDAYSQPIEGFTHIFSSGQWAVKKHFFASAAFSDQLAINTAEPNSFAALAYTFPADGSLSFNYAGTPANAFETFLFRIIDSSGVVVTTWEGAPTGQVAQNIVAGQTLLVYLRNDHTSAGEYLNISNWFFEPAISNNVPLCSGLVRVTDGTDPVLLTQTPLVEIGDDSLAMLSSAQLDAGSFDNCLLESMEMRRLYTNDPLNCQAVTPYYSDWGNVVSFSCCDACLPVSVELRLRDAAGNETLGTQIVIPEETNKPLIVIPALEPICCPDPAQCQAIVQNIFTVVDNCSGQPDISVHFDAFSDNQDLIDLSAQVQQLPNGTYKIQPFSAPLGQHELIVNAKDPCGNESQEVSQVYIADCTGGYPPVIMLNAPQGGQVQAVQSHKNKMIVTQNHPNPYSENTLIRFWLPAPDAVSFYLSDANGCRLYHIQQALYAQGWHTIEVDASLTPGSGVYFYQLNSSNQSVKKKMVRIE